MTGGIAGEAGVENGVGIFCICDFGKSSVPVNERLDNRLALIVAGEILYKVSFIKIFLRTESSI